MEQTSSDDIGQDVRTVAQELSLLRAQLQRTKDRDYGTGIKQNTKKSFLRENIKIAVQNLQIIQGNMKSDREMLEATLGRLQKEVIPRLSELKDRCKNRAVNIDIAMGFVSKEESQEVLENVASDLDLVAYSTLQKTCGTCQKRITALKSLEIKVAKILQKIGVVETWIAGATGGDRRNVKPQVVIGSNRKKKGNDD